METRKRRNTKETLKRFSVSKWSFQLLKRNDLLAESWICSLSNRLNSFKNFLVNVGHVSKWFFSLLRWDCSQTTSLFRLLSVVLTLKKIDDGREELQRSLGGAWGESIFFQWIQFLSTRQSRVIWPWKYSN